MHQLRGRDEKLPNVVCMHRRYRVPEGLGGGVGALGEGRKGQIRSGKRDVEDDGRRNDWL